MGNPTALVFAVVACLSPLAEAAIPVTLTPSVRSPAPLGTLVTWTASASQSGTLWYRFRARPAGGEFAMVRDFGPEDTLNWTSIDHEGRYEIELLVRNTETGDTGSATASYELTSRVTGGAPVVNPTSHPLVFLYSTPPCPAGGRMKVRFQSEGVAARTPYQSCREGLSTNFYIAGMRPDSDYTLQQVTGDGEGGPVLSLRTPAVTTPAPLPAFNVTQAPVVPHEPGVLLHSIVFQAPVATDLAGNLLWYYPGLLTFMTRPSAGGTFFGLVQDYLGGPDRQVLREFDLAGFTVRETNAARINEQLAAKGVHLIGSFHHEAIGLPGGKVLTLASTERFITDIQGPGQVDVIGEMILVLDRNLQVEWTWDAFDHMDVSRKATLGEVCTPGAGGCPPFYLSDTANDWLHGNGLQLTPDGNILFSARHQDWVVKINYDNGQGNGDILYRIGKDGDFRILSSDPSPWFSHQHDPNFEADNTTLTLFDNGNLRNAVDPSANSRGQVLRLDETNRVAELVLNADLGAYAFALGSAQKLGDGNYHFDAGWTFDGTGRYVEVDPAGNVVYSLSVGAPVYRSFRMADLYRP